MTALAAVSVWQLVKVWNEEPNQRGLWFGTRVQNTLNTFLSYQMMVGVMFSLLLAPVIKGVNGEIFDRFLSTYPEFTFLNRNICLNFMFSNNLAAFFATLFKYKIVRSAQKFFGAMILLMNFGMTIPVMGSFFAVADGMMAHEWASILG